jgi:transcriptional regulator with XRE-family HTH domain
MRVYAMRYHMSKADGRNGQPPVQSRVGMPRRKQEDSSFGPRLAELRRARGLTQVQLAEAAGTTQRAISYYENDSGFPPASALIDLAQALKVSTDELLGIKALKVERIDSDPEVRRMWKRFQQIAGLPEKDQRAVIRLISSLVSMSAQVRRRAS